MAQNFSKEMPVGKPTDLWSEMSHSRIMNSLFTFISFSRCRKRSSLKLLILRHQHTLHFDSSRLHSSRQFYKKIL